MTSQSSSTLQDDLVPSINRKHRAYLNHTERLDHLHHVSNKNRDRANFTNKLENFRLQNTNKQIDCNELHQMRALLKFKNDLKFNLVDIAKTKRRLNGSETEFERHLRDGSNEPVFLMEYNRLRQKEHELQCLKDRLEAPNSQILVKRVIDELKNIELRCNMASGEFRTGKFNLLPPISSKDDDVTDSTTDNHENTNQQAISSQNLTPTLYQSDRSKEIEANKSKRNKYKDSDEVIMTESIKSQKIKKSRLRMRNSTIKGKRHSKANVFPRLKQSANPEGKTQNGSYCPVQTNERERREKETEERLTDLKEKTKYDIDKRRSSTMLGIIEPRDSLKTLKCFETFTKLHLKNSGASIVERSKPETKIKDKKKRETQRRSSDICKLPPLNLNTNLVRELKYQRIRHKKESEGLPKLP
ncbi:uncharacterized protein [Antedon mediterranea]